MQTQAIVIKYISDTNEIYLIVLTSISQTTETLKNHKKQTISLSLESNEHPLRSINQRIGVSITFRGRLESRS